LDLCDGVEFRELVHDVVLEYGELELRDELLERDELVLHGELLERDGRVLHVELLVHGVLLQHLLGAQDQVGARAHVHACDGHEDERLHASLHGR
jgi:hypothetical protein